MGKLYDDLREGFEDIIAHRKGKITLRADRIETLESSIRYTAKAIKKVCKKKHRSK